MNKQLQFDNDARNSILHGMEILAKAVGSTLGPKGQCVVIDDYFKGSSIEDIAGKPLITKDGVTVAKNIRLKDKFENLGCQLLKEASAKSNDISGDGTTSTVVLAYDMIKRASKLIESGKNPIQIKQAIAPICQDVLERLKQEAIPIQDDDIEKVATISANNDPEIGKLIADAFKEVGKNGILTVEESSSFKTYVDVINGMQFENGYVSPFFATDEIKGNCVLEKPLILLTDRKIQLMKELVPILEHVAKSNRPILIIAQDYDDEVIQNLKLNKVRGVLKVCAVRAPLYGEYRKELLQDLAILTESQVITYESGIELTKTPTTALGSCEKVVITRDNTTIINGSGKSDIINARIAQIEQLEQNLADSLDQDFLKQFYAIRKARLSGGVGVIHVGGTTDLEMKERKDRIEDAVCATKCAIEEGIVPGGGISFAKIGVTSLIWELPGGPSAEESIILDGLWAVFNQIIFNSGINIKDIDIDPENNIGFDANKMKSVDMIKNGIINPAKSDRCALENAFSVLNLYLSTNTLIVNEEIQL